MKVMVEGGRAVTLRTSEFVAEGGEGRIWARKGTAYKVYTDATRILSTDKIAALSRIDCDDVITPQRRLLDPSSHAPVGYTMRHVSGAWILGQLFARSFCDRHGFDLAAACALIARMRDAVAAVHAADVLLVDFSDVNVLVDPLDGAPAFIDTDSWQTPNHAATAVTPATCDPRAQGANFTEGSDWYAFAILSFQLLVGIHPFRGKHPAVKGLTARMAAGLSVLDPSVSTPLACRPLDVIPPHYRAWYEALFVDGRRDAPPVSMSAPLCANLASIPSDTTQTALQLTALGSAAAPIQQAVPSADDPGLWLYTDAGLQRGPGGALVSGAPPRGQRSALAVDPNTGWVIATVDRDGEGLSLQSDRRVAPEHLVVRVDALSTTADGRVIVRNGGHLMELSMTASGPHQVMVFPRVIGSVLPHATVLGSGVALQNILGRAHVHLLHAPGVAPQVRIEALDGYRILDAKYERGTLIVTGRRADSTHDLASRFTIRFAPNFQRYAITRVDDVEDPTVDFTVTDAGICVARGVVAPDLDVFVACENVTGNAPESGPLRARRLDAAAIGTAWLARTGNGSVVAIGERDVLRVRLAPPSARATI
ncbi:MAG: hypothetical protein JKY37_17445 [Nannocystaceae bacterium]|nr:hypothetical protein [Nannocystaceae bacterium]